MPARVGEPVIRRGLVAPLSSALRMVGRAARGGPLWDALTEPAIYLLGWGAWALDWVFRLPRIGLSLIGRMGPAVIDVRPILLFGPGHGAVPPEPALDRARQLCADASVLLEPHGIALAWEEPTMEPRPASLPPCSARGLFTRFFLWASARADARALTVYLVEDFGDLAGCSYPGADWVVLDSRTDGTTLVHELGHLADLWSHTKDPHNLMTDQPAGSHDRLTRVQLAMIRTSRFARGVRVASASVPGRREVG
jgi:hypothetical protein